jgi:hypothetical protein
MFAPRWWAKPTADELPKHSPWSNSEKKFSPFVLGKL